MTLLKQLFEDPTGVYTGMNNLADKPEPEIEQDLENESPETQDVVDESFEIEVSDDTPEEEKNHV